MSFLNLSTIVYNYFPWSWRDGDSRDLTDSYVYALNELNNKDTDLQAFSDIVIYSAEHINLEAYCNDVFDPVLRRIFITDSADTNAIYLGLDSEEPDGVVYLGLDSEEPEGVVYLGVTGDITAIGKVVVHVPAALSYLNGEILQGVDNYVRAGVVIEIINF